MVSLNRLSKLLEPIASKGDGSKLLALIFRLIIEDKGPNYLQDMWQSSGVVLADFMNQNQVDAFIKDNVS